MLKKILIFSISFLCLLIFSEKSEARIYSIIPMGSPIVTETTITQNFMMRLREFREWELLVKAENPYWVNIENPAQKFPATNTEFTTSDGTFRLSSTEEVEIYEGDFTPYTTLFFSVTVDNIQGVPSGTYNLDLDFTINNDTFKYTMSIYVPPTLDITSTVPTAYINLTESDVFNLNSETPNIVDTQINIKSNNKWNLFLDTSSFGNAIGNYKYEVLSGEGANLIIPSKTKNSILFGQTYLLAAGDSSYTSYNPATEIPTFIRIRFYLNNNTQTYFQEGSYTNNLIYRIEEK